MGQTGLEPGVGRLELGSVLVEKSVVRRACSVALVLGREFLACSLLKDTVLMKAMRGYKSVI